MMIGRSLLRILTPALLFGLLASGCSEAPDAQDQDDTADSWQEPSAADDNDPEAQSDPAYSDSEPDEPLGMLVVTLADERTALAVTRCEVRSIPGQELAIAWFWIDASDASAMAADASNWQLEFQLQAHPDRTDVALLAFDHPDTELLATGSNDGNSASNHTFTADGAPFDLRTGSNGALQPVFDPDLEPPTITAAVTFSAAAQRATNNDAAPFEDVAISAELAAQCDIHWRR